MGTSLFPVTRDRVGPAAPCPRAAGVPAGEAIEPSNTRARAIQHDGPNEAQAVKTPLTEYRATGFFSFREWGGRKC